MVSYVNFVTFEELQSGNFSSHSVHCFHWQAFPVISTYVDYTVMSPYM